MRNVASCWKYIKRNTIEQCSSACPYRKFLEIYVKTMHGTSFHILNKSSCGPSASSVKCLPRHSVLYTARPSISGTGWSPKDDDHYILRFNHLAAAITHCDSLVIDNQPPPFFFLEIAKYISSPLHGNYQTGLHVKWLCLVSPQFVASRVPNLNN